MNSIIDPSITPILKIYGFSGKYNIADPGYPVIFKEIKDEFAKGWFSYDFALNQGLIPNNTYIMNMIDVDKFKTAISLKGIDGEFDSCMFMNPDSSHIISQ
jgi:hypothetical protein